MKILKMFLSLGHIHWREKKIRCLFLHLVALCLPQLFSFDNLYLHLFFTLHLHDLLIHLHDTSSEGCVYYQQLTDCGSSFL